MAAIVYAAGPAASAAASVPSPTERQKKKAEELSCMLLAEEEARQLRKENSELQRELCRLTNRCRELENIIHVLCSAVPAKEAPKAKA